MNTEKQIVYCNRVRIGNWYEASKLEEHRLNKFLSQMENGNLMLAKYRKMSENLNTPTTLTQATGSIAFGSRISLLAPHVPNSDPPVEGKKGLLLGGRISSDAILYSQELCDGCHLVGTTSLQPTEGTTFVITSPDYCNRDGELLKFNQDFLLVLSSSTKKKPLYIRYDPDPFPGLTGHFSLFLSEHPVTNTRWRILPVQNPLKTRFEHEGEPVKINQDIIVNHSATNVNLGFSNFWAMGFYGKICAPRMKTCLDIYKCELPQNIWQIYIPISS